MLIIDDMDYLKITTGKNRQQALESIKGVVDEAGVRVVYVGTSTIDEVIPQ